ncbi:MAG TPA: hypothetical protein VF835_00565 [Rhizomicrobium sp.]
MYKFCVGCLALLLLGCDERPVAIPQSPAALASSYMQCLRETSLTMDDHRSDASVIGAAVAQRCSSEHDFAAMTSSVPEISDATVIVLSERNNSPH